MVVGIVTYIAIVLLLKMAGKRTLANMNALDFIITVAIGSAYGRILTAQTITISEAVVAFLVLVSIQIGVSKLEVVYRKFGKFMMPAPKILYYKGEYQIRQMKKERINKRDLLAVLRKKSFTSLDQVDAIVLESNGQFSIIGKTDKEIETLKDLT
ncbi:MAG: DUF421 domain-containing protein [Candidatus Cyclobacteriaceae bacterium M3_2C_046]